MLLAGCCCCCFALPVLLLLLLRLLRLPRPSLRASLSVVLLATLPASLAPTSPSL